MNFKNIQKALRGRNLVSYAVAGIVLIGFFWGICFFIKEYSFYLKEHKFFQQKYGKITSLEGIMKEKEILQRQSSEMGQMINDLNIELKQMEARFSPLSPESYEQTKLLVLDLAMRCGFRVTDENMLNINVESLRRRNPYIHSARKAQASRKTFFESYPKEMIGKRPGFKFKATTTFSEVRIFFRELQHLKWHVTPVKFAFTRKEITNQPALPNIESYNNFGRTRTCKKENFFQQYAGDLEVTVFLAL